MSQAGIISATGSSPAIPTSFVTDDGTAVPAANTLNLTGIDSSENNDNGILTRANPNLSDNAFVVLTNRLQGTGSTSGAVTDDLITFDLGGTAAVYRFEFKVAGRDTGTGDGVGYSLEGSARTDGATATIIATPNIDNDEDASLLASSLDLIASGNNVILRITGVAGQDLVYSATGLYEVV